MSGSRDRKTEEPTDRRLRDARDDGQIARSQDVITAAVMVACGLTIWFARDWIGAQLRILGRLALDYPGQVAEGVVEPNMVEAALRVALAVAWLVFPVLAIAMAVAVVVGIVQSRGLFAPAAIVPHVERLNPVEGLRELFSLRALIDLGKALLKMALLGTALYLVIRWSIGALVKLPYQNADSIASITVLLFAAFFGTALIIFVVIAAFDFWLQRIVFLRSQRMTPEEVKRERHEDLGRPEVRARRREVAMEDVLNPLLERTAQSSVIIRAASGDCAVALITPREEGAASWVVNKGIDQYAKAIVAVARDSDVLVIDDALLARRIHDLVAIDADLTPALNQALKLQLARMGI